nr:hypothetical protein [Chitinimonas taiwanensis]
MPEIAVEQARQRAVFLDTSKELCDLFGKAGRGIVGPGPSEGLRLADLERHLYSRMKVLCHGRPMRIDDRIIDQPAFHLFDQLLGIQVFGFMPAQVGVLRLLRLHAGSEQAGNHQDALAQIVKAAWLAFCTAVNQHRLQRKVSWAEGDLLAGLTGHAHPQMRLLLTESLGHATQTRCHHEAYFHPQFMRKTRHQIVIEAGVLTLGIDIEAAAAIADQYHQFAGFRQQGNRLGRRRSALRHAGAQAEQCKTHQAFPHAQESPVELMNLA